MPTPSAWQPIWINEDSTEIRKIDDLFKPLAAAGSVESQRRVASALIRPCWILCFRFNDDITLQIIGNQYNEQVVWNVLRSCVAHADASNDDDDDDDDDDAVAVAVAFAVDNDDHHAPGGRQRWRQPFWGLVASLPLLHFACGRGRQQNLFTCDAWSRQVALDVCCGFGDMI